MKVRGGVQPHAKAMRNRAMLAMRKEGAAYVAIAAEFGVSHQRARKVCRREAAREKQS